MFCTKCGAENVGGSKFCNKCGKLLTAQMVSMSSGEDPGIEPLYAVQQEGIPKAGKSKSKLIIITAVCAAVLLAAAFFVFFKGVGNTPDTSERQNGRPGEQSAKPAAEQLEKGETGEEQLDKEHLGAEAFVLSISPTGKYILTADLSVTDIDEQPSVRKNNTPEVNYISLYEEQDGVYTRSELIDIDADTNPSLKTALETCNESSFAWSGDESRLILTAGAVVQSGQIADIFLIDFTETSIKNLTNRESMPEEERYGSPGILPVWSDTDRVYLIRHSLDDYEFNIRLVSIDITTGEQRTEANLLLDAPVSNVDDFVIFNDTAYYIMFA